MRKSHDTFRTDPLRIVMDGEDKLKAIWDSLAVRSGFPEPYLAKTDAFYRRWSSTYTKQMAREDVRDLAGVKLVQDLENLFLLLPSKVGSPFSIPSLSRDLKVAYTTS